MSAVIWMVWVIMLGVTAWMVSQFTRNKLYITAITFLIVDAWMLLIWAIVKTCCGG